MMSVEQQKTAVLVCAVRNIGLGVMFPFGVSLAGIAGACLV